MKTKFFSMLALFTVCFATTDTYGTTLPVQSSNLNNIFEINGEEDVFFKVKFVFERGRKNEAGMCHDRGICRFEFEVGFRSANPGGLDGEIGKDRSGNILLVIEKGNVTVDDAIDITGFAEGPGTLQLSNNSDIPEEVKSELGLPAKYQLKAGSYQVTETKTTYIINFGK